ncbi:MAG: transposase [Anaerolineales bacterium]
MIMGNPLPFVEAYVEQLSAGLESHQPKAGLSRGQKAWLSFGLMGIMVTESVCWRKWVRAGLGRYSEALLSWYFRGPMAWGLLLSFSVKLLLESFGTWEGVLVLDDTGKRRAKVTKRIPYVHYFKDKQGTGTMRGQEIVFLVLVTAVVTIPVAFAFYQPDPAYSAWAKADKRLKRQGVSKAKRPAPPPDNPAYPSKPQLALRLLEQFAHDHPLVKVKAILADALYGSAAFMAQAAKPWGEAQVISQLRHDQKVRYRGRSWRLDEYFRAHPGVRQTVRIRGGERVEVWVSSARLYVEAHGGKRFVVAIRYPDQDAYRYLVATELSWRSLDIVQAHTLRWLVEVAIEDLKVYEGWGQATKQPGDEGSSRGLILSLLCDHCLLLHPDQQARVDQQQPLSTIGSLQRRLQLDSLVAWLQQWLGDDTFADKLDQLTQAIQPLFPLQPSKKHLHRRDWGRLEPTPALQYRARQAKANA